MAFKIPKPKALIVGVSTLLLIVAIVLIATPTTSALTTTDWITPTQAITQTQADNFAYLGTDTTLKNAIDPTIGNKPVLIMKRSSDALCQMYVLTNTSARFIIEFNSDTNTRVSATSGTVVTKANGSQACNIASGSTNTAWSTATTSENASWSGTTNISYMINYNYPVSSITYTGTYSGSTSVVASDIPVWTAGYTPPVDLCSNIPGTQATLPIDKTQVGTECWDTATLYNNLIQRTTTIATSYNYGSNPAYSAVTGSTNDQCKPGVNWQQNVGANWQSIAYDPTYDLYSNMGNFRTALSAVLDGSQNGGYLVLANEGDKGYKSFTIYVWYGIPSLTWHAPGDVTYPEGAVFLNSSGLTSRYVATFTPNCSIFASDGTKPTIQPSVSAWSSPQKISSTHTSTLTVGDQTVTYSRKLAVFKGLIISNYPSGYAGELFEGGIEVTDRIYADFDLQIEAFDIIATYRGSQYDDPKCTVLIWRLANADDPYNILQFSTTVTQPLQQRVSEAGTYRLDVTWSWRITDFATVGLNPADEDYCQDKNSEIVDLFNDGKLPYDTGKAFPVDGLSSLFLGYDQDRECQIDDESGNGFGNSMLCVYSTDITLEDCSAYGIDELHTRFGCEIANLFKRFKSMLSDMWVVRPYFVQSRLDDFNNHVQQNMSILTYPVAFASDMVSLTTSSSTVCPQPEIEFMGATADIDLCSMEEASPATWHFIQIGIASLFSVFIVIALHGAYHRLWSSSEV